MARIVSTTPQFEKDRKALAKKHRDVSAAADAFLNKVACDPLPTGDLIPGVGGRPVYKARLAYGNVSKRDAARIIYYSAEQQVVGLFLYAKSDHENIPAHAIKAALADAGLLGG